MVPLVLFFNLMIVLCVHLNGPASVIAGATLRHPIPAFRLPLLTSAAHAVAGSGLPSGPFLLGI